MPGLSATGPAATGDACAEANVDRRSSRAGALLRALRPLHWSKNLLVFVPLLEGHVRAGAAVGPAALAFCALCLLASAGYVLNDLHDLESDRRHLRKCTRPLAAGDLSVGDGRRLAWAVAAAGLGVAATLPTPVFVALVGYFAGGVSYTLWFRPVPMLDVLVLAVLFTLRLMAGALAIGAPLFPHFYGISFALFVSLALVKRTAELQRSRRLDRGAPERPYRADDVAALAMFGISTGVAAVAAGAGFVASPQAHQLYARPQLLWALVPASAFWLLRLWLLAWRGQLEDDPVVFVVRDRVGYGVGALAAAVIAASL
jgi:4-hydroxybenzoate polyprenyltransferase